MNPTTALYISVSSPRDGSDCDEKAGYEENTGAEHKLFSIQLLSLLSCYTESKKVQAMAKKVVVDYSFISVNEWHWWTSAKSHTSAKVHC